MTASIHGGNGGGKHSKSALNLRETVIYFGSIRIKATTVFDILRIEPGASM